MQKPVIGGGGMKTCISIRGKVLGALLLVTAGFYTPAHIQSQDVGMKATKESPSAAQRKVFVRSEALLVRASVVENKLMKRAEFNQLGLVLTRNEADADIILELRHDVLTKYVYSAVDTKTQTVIAGGKVSSLGGTVAGKVAKRFLKQLAQGHP
jgi:hypothetical protein